MSQGSEPVLQPMSHGSEPVLQPCVQYYRFVPGQSGYVGSLVCPPIAWNLVKWNRLEFNQNARNRGENKTWLGGSGICPCSSSTYALTWTESAIHHVIPAPFLQHPIRGCPKTVLPRLPLTPHSTTDLFSTLFPAKGPSVMVWSATPYGVDLKYGNWNSLILMCVANTRHRPSQVFRYWSRGNSKRSTVRRATLTAISMCSGCSIAVEYLIDSHNFPQKIL